MRRVVSFASLVIVLAAASPALARVIFVDNRLGDDTNDGAEPTVTGLSTGPVRSLRRAGVLVRPGDVVEIADTGFAYYDSLSLVGGRCSGVPSRPVVVNGNGAVIDGSEPVDPAAWEPLGGGLWRLEMSRMAWYWLVRGEIAVPKADVRTSDVRPNPPSGRWAAWRGAIYYHAEPDELPANEPYRVATRDAGVFLYGVRHVVVRDLTVRHFRLDGVNAHDQVSDTLFQGVTSESNGRSGISVGGSAAIVVTGGVARGNGEASLRLEELGKVDVRDAAFDTEPVVIE